jgi:predicted permease
MRVRPLLARCAHLLTRRRADTRLDEEIQTHLDALAEEYEARGMSPDDARREARRAFGGVMQMKEAHREQRTFLAVGAFDALARDCQRAMRRLVATPGPTLFSIATLAVAIGVTTATYSVLIAMFGTTSRDIRDPASLVNLSAETNAGTFLPVSISSADYRELLNQQHSLSHVAAWAPFATSLMAAGTPQLVTGELVSGAYFETVGVSARLGRTIGPDDDRAGAPPVVVLTDTTWRTRFGGDPSVIGRTIALAGRPFTVIGVGQSGFSGLLAESLGMGVDAACWVPLAFANDVMGRLAPAALSPSDPDGGSWLRIIGRLNPTVTVRQAAEELGVIGQRLQQRRPPAPSRGPGLRLPPTRWSATRIVESSQSASLHQAKRVILTLPVLVLLIACTNLTNLALSRGMSRQRTFAIRRALGASRWRVVREDVIEGALVALAGGLAALGVARLLLTAMSDVVRGPAAVLTAPIFTLDFSLEPAVLFFAAGTTILALIVGTLAPALQLSRTSVNHALGRDADTTTPRWRGRRNLIALQVGASVGLFLVAFASMTYLRRTAPVSRGPNLDHVAAAGIPFDRQAYDEARARDALDRALVEIRRIPGMTTAGVVSAFRGVAQGAFRSFSHYAVSSIDRPFTDRNDHQSDNGVSADGTVVSPGVFAALALSIANGRAFDDTDTASSERVVIVNDALARAWPNGALVPGRHVYVKRESPFDPTAVWTARVVGIAADGGDPSRRGDARIYLPFTQAYEPNLIVLAVAAPGAAPPVEALRAALRRADPNLAARFVEPGPILMNAVERMLRVLAIATSSLAALALLFAMTGLYGVLSHVVAHRTREMAIRAALGADRRAIATMVLKDGLRPVAEGLVIGLGVATAIRAIMQMTVARGLSSIDAAAFGLAAIVLIVAALAACWLPARRATKVDPNIALRDL